MKKGILFIIGIFIMNSAFSQGIDLGIKAGANFANLTDATDSSTRTGLVAGVFGGVKFSDKIGIQGDLLFSQQGADFDTSSIDLTYINFPIVLKYYIVKKLNIHAGPQFGLLIDDNFEIIEPETADVSGVVGIGVDIVLGIRASGRYNFGLTDILSSASSKNSVFSVSVEWSFL